MTARTAAEYNPAMLNRYVCAIVIASSGALAGCGMFDSACGAALPVVQQAVIYGDDAEASLLQLQKTFASISLDAGAQAKVDRAFQKAWQALKTAQAGMLAASEACSKIDPVLVFSDFIKAWKALQVLLGEHSSQLQAAPGPNLYAPAIVLKAAGR